MNQNDKFDFGIKGFNGVAITIELRLPAPEAHPPVFTEADLPKLSIFDVGLKIHILIVPN